MLPNCCVVLIVYIIPAIIAHTLNTRNPLTLQNKIDLLTHLNMFRSNTAKYNKPTVSNMNFVFWDESLAKISQDTANSCAYQDPLYTNFLRYQEMYSEWEYPSIGSLISYGITSNRNDLNISSQLISLLESIYTQPITNDTNHQMFGYLSSAELRYFGCGYKECPMIGIMFYCTVFYTNSTLRNHEWIDGEPCSECPIDKNKCWKGLCAYCMSSDYYINDPPNERGDVCSNLGIDYSIINDCGTGNRDSGYDNDVLLVTHRAIGIVIIVGIVLSILCIITLGVLYLMYTNANRQNGKHQIQDNADFNYVRLCVGVNV